MPHDTTEREEKQELKAKDKAWEALEQEVTLWLDETGEPHADFIFNKKVHSVALSTPIFKAFVTYRIFQLFSSPPEKKTVDTLINMMTAKALLEGTTFETFLRVCRKRGYCYYDLGNGKMVEVNANCWKVVPKNKIKFLTSGVLRPQVEPLDGGNINLLRKYLNVSDDDFKLVVFWLLGSLAAHDGYYQIILNGPKDAGKSTTTKLLRKILDPASAEHQSPPKDQGDVNAAARNNFVVAMDNLSWIPPWLSDTLCRLSTGGGLGGRALYTNHGSSVFNAFRPVILNGIPQFVSKTDLMDRVILVMLKSVEADKRDEWYKQFETEFDKDLPYILGALFSALTVAIRDCDDATMKKMPRCISFAKNCIAAEKYFGWQGEFERLWTKNMELKSELFIETDPMSQALLAYFQEAYEANKPLTLKGKISDIKSALIMNTGLENMPKSDKDFALKLTQLKDDLSRKGIYVAEPQRSHKGTIYEVHVMNKEKFFG